MSRLDRLKELIDRRLGRVHFTQADRAQVYERIEARKKERKRGYTLGFSIGAAAVAVAMIALLVIPAIGNGKGLGADGSTAESVFESKNLKDTKDTSGTKNTGGNKDIGSKADPDTDDSEKDPAAAPSAAAPLTEVSGVEVQGISVTALRAYSGGVVSCDTGFTINTEESALGAEEVGKLLHVEPKVAYSLLVEDKDHLALSFSEPLPAGEIIRLSVGEEQDALSWAFQTESTMTVRGTTPGDGSRGMPLDTGIEIVFSLTPGSGADAYFSIEPQAKGRFLTKGKTLIFVPNEDLAADCTYTITLKKGLPAASGETLGEDYSFSFRTPTEYTGDEQYWLYYNGSVTSNFYPGQTVAFEVYASDDLRDRDLDVQIYAVSSAEEYASLVAQGYDGNGDAWWNPGNAAFDLSGKTPVITTTARITEYRVSDWMTKEILILPDLEEGFYVARITAPEDAGGKGFDKLIQVTPISFYYENAGGDALVWLNSTQTGRSVSGAQVTFTQNGAVYSAKTDESGVARFRTDSGKPIVIQASSSAGTYIDAVNGANPRESTAADLYYSYLYLDRSAYLPTDTVHFWGMLVPRKDGTALPSQVELTLQTGMGEPRSAGTVQVNADGSFSGEVSFSHYISGYFDLNVCIGGETVTSRYFMVTDYTKPSYVLELTLDRSFYLAGDIVTANGKASFYDGTPASWISVSLEYSGKTDTYQTDGNGCFTASFTAKDSGFDWLGNYFGVNAQIIGVEDVYVWAYASAVCFRSADMLTARQQEGTSAVEICANAIDFAAMEEHLNDYASDPDSVRGAPVTLSGSVSLIRHYYIQRKTGSYYDEILKRRVDTYDYDYTEEICDSCDFTTSDGKAVTKAFDLSDKQRQWYSAKITYADENGVWMEKEIYLTNQVYVNPYNNGYRYETIEDLSDRYLKVGAEATLQLIDPQGEKVTSGALLCTVIGDAILDTSVETNGMYTLRFTKEYIRNVYLYSAYFDGRQVHVIPQQWFEYDTSDAELTVTVTPDKERYAPGESVKAKVEIRDKNGAPVQAGFVLSVVDEAAFAVMEQEEDPLVRLYAWRSSPRVVVYGSYDDPTKVDMVAEGGGEGGTNGLREDFKDVAAYVTGSSDASGKAEVSFALPENLTSWRMTCVAVSKDGKAGVVKKNVAVSLDFFLSLLAGESYTAGDSVSMAARVYGAEAGQKVEYEMYLDDEYLGSVSGRSGNYTFLNLGKLASGVYRIGIRAVCGGQSDGIIRTVTVRQSRHSFLHYQYGLLSEGVRLDADRYPITLLVYDAENNAYAIALSKLLGGGTARADFYLGSALAADKLREKDENSWITAPDPMTWQDYGGGVTLLPYASPDARTTAMALVCAPDYIDAAAAADYLYEVLSDRDASSEEVCAAYMGLAAMNEPVLADINRLIRYCTPNQDEYFYLSCGLALLGDRAAAAKRYENLFADKIATLADTAYISAGGAEENYERTAQALMLASLLGREEAGAFALYLAEGGSDKYAPNFELTCFVSRYRMRTQDSAFTCVIDGQKRSYDFADEEHSLIVLQFAEDGLDRADFRVTRGKVAYMAVYSASLGQNEQTAGTLASVRLASDTLRASPGGQVDFVVTVNVSQQCLDDFFTVDIVLPSGVRYSSYEYNYSWDGGYSLVSNEKGRLRFVISRSDRSRNSGVRSAFTVSIRIHTTAVLPGTYMIEEPVLQLPASNLTAIGARSQIAIE